MASSRGLTTAGSAESSPHRIGKRGVILVSALMLLAGFLRLAGLERYPELVNEDELSNAYDGWSIAQTGADRSGRRYPILCRGWGPGDNRPALFAWLCAGVSAWTGFSMGACRAVSGVLGTVTVGLVGLWAYRRFGRWAGLVATAMLAVSPWHLLFSRLAHEGTALVGLFCILIVLLVGEAARRQGPGRAAYGWWLVTGFVIGFSANAYAATRLTALLFALCAAVILIARGWSAGVGARRLVISATLYLLAAGVGAGPQLWVLATDYEAFVGRLRMIRIHVVGVLDAIETVVGHVASLLAPRFLFYSFGESSKFAVGRLSFVTLPLFYLGLIVLLVPRTGIARVERWLLLAGMLICMSPSVLTRGCPNALRASGCAVLFPMVSVVAVAALLRCIEVLAERIGAAGRPMAVGRVVQGWLACSITVAVLVAGASYIWRYTRSDELPRVMQQVDPVRLGRWLGEHARGFDRVYIEPGGNQLDLYIVAFGGMRPEAFQRAHRVVWGEHNEYCIKINQYEFIDQKEALRRWEASAKDERWLVTDVAVENVLVLGGSLREDDRSSRGRTDKRGD